MKYIVTAITVLLLLSGCSKNQSQNEYSFEEVGKAVMLEYAEVLAVKPVAITGHAAGNAAANSPFAGHIAEGSYISSEIGTIWGTGQGAVEQAAAEKKGYEYIIVTENNTTKTVVQYLNPDDIVFKPGDLVLLQSTGSFNRLLTTENIPAKIKNPHRRKIEEPQAEPAPPSPPLAPESAIPPPPQSKP
jgi:outer membrane lipoprotein SlyB